MQTESFKLTEKKNAQIKNINSQLNATVSELRKRPSRIEFSSNSSSNASNTSPCTGAQLSREDGEFLAGEAARAQVLVAERDYYYNLYEQARIKLNERN